MADTLSREEFEHFHRDGIKNLELERLTLDTEPKVAELAPIDTELRATVTSAITELSGPAADSPEHVFSLSMKALGDIEANRFVLHNLLEALKNGHAVQDTLARYKKLGLIRAAMDATTATEDLGAVGAGLVRRKGIVRRMATAIVQIGVNAFKSVPKWVEIEPTITLGPIPSLSFTLKGKGMSVQELFETLRGPLKGNGPSNQ